MPKTFIFSLFSLLLTYNASQFSLPSFHFLSTLSEVPRSGDSYPKTLPKLSNPQLYSNKRLLFVLSHGVEDHEVYYPHQYFSSRGATISFACPENFAIISDFFKPTHRLRCIPLETVVLEDFDGVYIPGGLPSSSAIRRESVFQSKLKTFYNNAKNKDKMLMFICSGTENLIESGIIDQIQEVTGSPASQWTFLAYYENFNRSLELYKGNSDDFPAIAYPSDGNHAHLVLGRNPMGAPAFVASIAKIWLNISEEPDVEPLNLLNDTWYMHQDFEILSDETKVKEIARVSTKAPSFSHTSRFFGLSGKKLYFAVGPAASFQEISELSLVFALSNVNFEFICPSWVIPYKNGDVFLFSDPPTTPVARIKCSKGFNEIVQGSYDAIVVAGGLFSSNGVLRNDGEIVDLLKKSKVVGLFGTGVDLLLPMKTVRGRDVVAVQDILGDLSYSGGVLKRESVEVLRESNGEIVISNGDVEGFLRKLQEVLGN